MHKLHICLEIAAIVQGSEFEASSRARAQEGLAYHHGVAFVSMVSIKVSAELGRETRPTKRGRGFGFSELAAERL